MSHDPRRLIACLLSASVLAAVVGCEDVEATPEDLAASPTPAGTQTSESADSADAGDAKSAYGKAYQRAERLEDEINAYQEEVIKTADGVFDDS